MTLHLAPFFLETLSVFSALVTLFWTYRSTRAINRYRYATGRYTNLEEVREVDSIIKSVRERVEQGYVVEALQIMENNNDRISSIIREQTKAASLTTKAAGDLIFYVRKGLKDKTRNELIEMNKEALKIGEERSKYFEEIDKNLDFILNIVRNYKQE